MTQFNPGAGLPEMPIHSPSMGTSLDRTMERFFGALAKEPFTYNGKQFVPKGIAVSAHTIRRSFNCLPNCGACCWSKLDLYWGPFEQIPAEALPYVEEAFFEVNGQKFSYMHDDKQTDITRQSGKCKHMNLETGRCSIHPKAIGTDRGVYPSVCSTFPFKISMYSAENRPNRLLSGHISRPWLSTQIDGTKGVKCFYTDEWPEDVKAEQIWSLERLVQWADYCGIKTWLPEIIEWIKQDMPGEALLLEPHKIPEIVIPVPEDINNEVPAEGPLLS